MLCAGLPTAAQAAMPTDGRRRWGGEGLRPCVGSAEMTDVGTDCASVAPGGLDGVGGATSIQQEGCTLDVASRVCCIGR